MHELSWIDDTAPLPSTRRALGAASEAPGLLCAGGRLSTQRLEEAYRRGVFPWYSHGQPVLWWTPDPRMVLPVAQFKLSRSLGKTLRKFIACNGNEIRIDHDAYRVIGACAQVPREGQNGTWIVPAMVRAYCDWHDEGRVHSFETWIDGELAGGLYGVGIGRMLFGESMFSHATDGSKIALAALVAFCRGHGIELIDCILIGKYQNRLFKADTMRFEIGRCLILVPLKNHTINYAYQCISINQEYSYLTIV